MTRFEIVGRTGKAHLSAGTLAQEDHVNAGQMQAAGRVVLVASPKGGVGKSSIARNLLVSAAYAKLRVFGLDFDRQETLAKWHARRERVRRSFPEAIEVPVVAAPIGEWRAALEDKSRYDLVVIDTPPVIEDAYTAALSLCAASDHVLVPTGATQDDIDSVVPWMRTLRSNDIRASFVLNKVNPRVKSFGTARNKLLQVGSLCPIEVPTLEDIHVSAGKGLAVLDMGKGKPTEIFEGVWTYVARELGFTTAEGAVP